ncbi:MAG TPA: hypothetical protein ENH82_04065 [bacterium]|nr:hypothetical protein [bacterium]
MLVLFAVVITTSGSIPEADISICIFFVETPKGAAQQHLGHKLIGSQYISIPPLQEQLGVIAKVNKLMALCDALEAQQENSITAHQTLVETLLSALTNAGEKGEFSQAWSRIAEHFDTLFTTEHSIDQLKQTILQLAVMGKLVPQDPSDVPASALLEKIAAEKERLIIDKKIRSQKKLPEIGVDEKPFDLPEGWEWLRLGDFSYVFSGNSFKSGDFNEVEGVRVIKITNAGVGELIETDDYLPRDFLDTYKNYTVLEGDLILALTRPYIRGNDGLAMTAMKFVPMLKGLYKKTKN